MDLMICIMLCVVQCQFEQFVEELGSVDLFVGVYPEPAFRAGECTSGLRIVGEDSGQLQ